MIGPFSILSLSIVILRCQLLLWRPTISSRLPIGKRFLLSLLIDVDLKLTEFQPGLGQVLLELILSPN